MEVLLWNTATGLTNPLPPFLILLSHSCSSLLSFAFYCTVCAPMQFWYYPVDLTSNWLGFGPWWQSGNTLASHL